MTSTQNETKPPLHGYHGRYLRIDLTTATKSWHTIDESVLRQYIGGTGLGAYILLREQQPEISPLAAESCIAFVFSPLVGGPLTTSAKFAVVCKSPLTDRYNDAMVSSGFAIAGKGIGTDAIVICGQAKEPSVLVIDEGGEIEIRPAGELWGQTVPVAEQRLSEQLSPGFKSAVIGPAGENLVSYATISHDGRHAGRGGSGTILGSKRIKAVAVRGNQKATSANPSQLNQFAKSLSKRSMGEATAKYRELGTASNLLAFNRLKSLPTRNFQQGSFAGAEAISPESMGASREKARTSCVACTIGCEHLYEIKTDDTNQLVRLEYENLFALGSLCSIDDADIVLRASRLCDEQGMDTISAGGTIAFAMECVEKGWIDAPWLTFGDGEALLKALDLISRRDELGDRLANGSRWLGASLGPDAAAIAPHVKGLEMPGYEPRAAQAMALGFAVGARGADHNRSGAYEADFSQQVDRRRADGRSVAAAIESEDRAALIDSLILCKFLRGVFPDLFAESAEMLQLVCGWDVDADELRETAQRIVNAKKLFNVLAGWTPAEDCLPDRFTDQPLGDDPQAVLPKERLTSLVQQYNVGRQWSADGWQSPQLIQELGLNGFSPQQL